MHKSVKSPFYLSVWPRTHILLFLGLTLSFLTPLIAHQKPRLTIVIVVDQFAYWELQRCRPYFKHGLNALINKGVNYINAYQPHGMPATATGHAALSTGTYAKDHGIISNTWVNEMNEVVHAGNDSAEYAAVFSPTGTYDYGISSTLLMVDTLSDQFSLQSLPHKQHYAYALSMKDRAATQLAGKLGKAVWFDNETGFFTSSKAYFDSLPIWIETFNKKHAMDTKEHVFWHQAKPRASNGYVFSKNQRFDYVALKKGLVETKIPIDWEKKPKDPFHLFVQTPLANKLLLECALACIDTHLKKNSNDHLLLWVSLSSLDKVGHTFGPHSKEVIDTLYHLDKQLERFMKRARRVVGQKNTLFVLTADHGISPIVEEMADKGFPAHRYDTSEIVDTLNRHCSKSVHANAIIKHYQPPYFYVDTTAFNTLSPAKQYDLLQRAASFLALLPGVKKVWTYDELQNSTFEPWSLESYYKNQLYPGRSGQLIVQLFPYYDITTWKQGADHISPYDFNTHIPLIMYQHGSLEHKTIGQRVFSLQLANTLADILQIPKPSASTSERLPGIEGEVNDLFF